MAARPVFISYSQPDREAAYGLVARVEASGIACWIAPRDVAPASDWAAEIVDAIAGARVMVLVFSGSTNDSPQVRREVERAVHRRVTVLPFRLADVLPSKSLEYFLSSQHWLDAFPPPLEPHYARLCEHLHALLATEAPPSDIGATTTSTPVLQAPPAAPARATPVLDAGQLRRVESELAGYIGPLARHLVKRAAASASGPEALITQLGAEIESEAERRRFMNACRQFLRATE